MDRAELKARARAQLGGGIFQNLWMMGLAVCLLIGYPVSYWMSREGKSFQRMAMVLIMLPMWMNFLLRTYSWMTILENNGLLNQLFQKIGQSPEIAYEIQEDQVIAGLVAQNFGIAVVPYMDELPRMNLDIIQISRPLWERNFYLATLKNRLLSPAAQNFHDYVVEHYASNPALTDL